MARERRSIVRRKIIETPKRTPTGWCSRRYRRSSPLSLGSMTDDSTRQKCRTPSLLWNIRDVCGASSCRRRPGTSEPGVFASWHRSALLHIGAEGGRRRIRWCVSPPRTAEPPMRPTVTKSKIVDVDSSTRRKIWYGTYFLTSAG